MATGLGGVNGCPDPDIGDSRKRPLDSELDIGATKRSHHGGGNGTFHFKILVPAVAAGAIIGKGGETIALLQKEAGARVKMSKSNDFYPGTTERVCLITGSVEGVLRIHEFIMEKIKEKPDPTAKIAIDFDHKQPAEREKQVKILVPNSTAGMIIGKGGSYIKQIKEESGAYVQISQKSKDHALAERCITVIGEMDNNKKACQLILAKIVEDPQSGSCLHVSYAEVTGPVANFNPTGSPYANPSSVHSTVNNSSASYSSSGSLNSLSPTANFGGAAGSMVPAAFPGANVAQLLENVKAVLRSNGYTEQATADIATAMGTLATYGVLGSSLGALLAGANGAMIGQGPPQPPPPQQVYPTSPMDATPPVVASSSGIFGPVGSGGFGSPRSERYHSDMVFDPFRRNSPALGSPGAAANNGAGGGMPVNNNSFGLGTALVPSQGAMCKSPPPPTAADKCSDAVKRDLEVGENIVGAILGPGGKSLVEIQRFSGAAIQISKKGTFAPGTRNRIVSITGTPNAVSTAQYLIEQQIAEEEAKRSQQNALGVLR
ncbi:RNA-binding protein Nova-1-like protein passilla isoform X1 [Rhipicephalus microplus]|uniref:RNA-binding protein Nova-1-like protein passilla isoform X1 n=1 Tax=Rhipicephalus microplus TaxID=6941 RepID=UPI00188732A0|nr:RNA-binding protein Nova-1-like isoform X1 [Rhipicephalus microplus]